MKLLAVSCSSIGIHAYPVPSRGIQHPRSQDVADNTTNVVPVTGQDHGLLSQTGRWNLGDEGVTDRSDGRIIDECEDQQHRANGPLCCRVRSRDDAEETDDQKQCCHDNQANEVQGAPAKPRNQSPGSEHSDRTQRVLNHTHGEGILGCEACLLVEVGGVTHKGRSAPDLNHPCVGSNFCAAKIRLLEAVQVARALGECSFHLVRVNHHGNCLIDVEALLVAGCKSENALLGLVKSALADKPAIVSVTREGDEDGALETHHHGDSGAKKIPTINGIGQIHWRAYGMRYAHSSGRRETPFKTPEAKN